MPRLIKRDGTREPFDEEKLRYGLAKALEKRPVSEDQIETAMTHIKHRLRSTGERELPAMRVGEEVMRELRGLEPVAYVRFASVYRDFQTSANLLTKYRNSIVQTLSGMLASDQSSSGLCRVGGGTDDLCAESTRRLIIWHDGRVLGRGFPRVRALVMLK